MDHASPSVQIMIEVIIEPSHRLSHLVAVVVLMEEFPYWRLFLWTPSSLVQVLLMIESESVSLGTSEFIFTLETSSLFI